MRHLFFSLTGDLETPHLVKIAAGGKNLITGKDLKDDFDGPQDFVVVPGQGSLGGVRRADGVHQLVMIPQDSAHATPDSLSGKQAAQLELRIYAPPEGWRADVPQDLSDFYANGTRGGGSRSQLLWESPILGAGICPPRSAFPALARST